jgi:hypothetical protein
MTNPPSIEQQLAELRASNLPGDVARDIADTIMRQTSELVELRKWQGWACDEFVQLREDYGPDESWHRWGDLLRLAGREAKR